MFKKEFRLDRNVKFNNSFTFSAPEFVLKGKKNGLIVNRFGIVVSKKIDKRATARNKIKRIFRSSLLDLNKNMTVGHDILFIVKIGILGKKKEEIQLAIKSVLEKAGFIKK